MAALRLLTFAIALMAGLAAAPGAWAQEATADTPAAATEDTASTPDAALEASTTEDTAATSDAAAQASATEPTPPADDTEVTTAELDYPAWQRTARRVEQALEGGRVSDRALETLRTELVTWRERFDAARAENQVRISTLKTQISTFGPPPAEGSTEPAILTERRDQLTAELDEAEAPNKAAELARAEATALIGEIDNMTRTRQTDALLSLGPTPLNPVYWPGALEDVTRTLKLAWAGVASAWGTKTQRAELRANLPLALLFAVVAITLLLRGRSWVRRFGTRMLEHSSGSVQGLWSFALSIVQNIVPLAGLFALVEALNISGVLGIRAQVMVDAIPTIGICFFTARWLGGQVFGMAGLGERPIFDLTPVQRAEGRTEATLLGLFYGLVLLFDALAEYEGYRSETQAVLDFPLIAVMGFLLLRFGAHMRRFRLPGAQDEAGDAEGAESSGFLTQTMRIGGALLWMVGVGGPLAAAVGYQALAESAVFPATLTLGLLAGLIILHRVYVDIYGTIFKLGENEAGAALVPVLATFVSLIAALPVLSLIWGARVTDLTEMWARVREGIVLGETVISPGDFFLFAVVFAIGFAATRLVQGMLKTTILPKTKLDIGGRNAITSGIGYVGIFLAAVAAITSAGINLSSLAIVAGALSVGIGFGLQNIVSNFVSGIILLIERPISEGDWIEVGGQMGYVRNISVRSTRIETFDRSDVILPNSDLISGVVTNYTRGNLIGRVIVPVGVAYGTDTRRVAEILLEIAKAHPLVAVNPAPSVIFSAFGADSLNFEIRAILRDVNFKLTVLSDMNHEIAARFVAEGIEVPFAQRDIWLRNPEALTGGVVAPGTADGGAEAEAEVAGVAPVTPKDARATLDQSDMHDTSAEDGTDE